MSTRNCTHTIPFQPRPARREPRQAWRALAALLISWQERARQRHSLRQLNDHALKDLGLSRSEVEREATKPFWQA